MMMMNRMKEVWQFINWSEAQCSDTQEDDDSNQLEPQCKIFSNDNDDA